jgi:uncharacterized membrane protein YphA (DoxX/SURF4 family)
MIPALAIIATAAETLLGLLLVLGWKTRITALLSGLLLITFALTMTMASGVKAPLNLSIFSAAGGALLLATCANFPFSLDELLRRVSQPQQSSDRERRIAQPAETVIPVEWATYYLRK